MECPGMPAETGRGPPPPEGGGVAGGQHFVQRRPCSGLPAADCRQAQWDPPTGLGVGALEFPSAVSLLVTEIHGVGQCDAHLWNKMRGAGWGCQAHPTYQRFVLLTSHMPP